MSTLTIPTAPVTSKSAESTAELHNNLLKIAKSDAPYENPIGEAEGLISFNGYYALNNTGAFLTVDTNLLVKNGEVTPHVSLIYSADGTSSEVYHLTGPNRDFESVNWNENILIAKATNNSNVPSFTLDFTREDNSQEITASLKGKITNEQSKTPINIQGATYNNPIPMAMYAGTYYEDKGKGDKILKIGTDNTLQYNYTNIGGDGGHLQEVDVFIYNLNMYVFSFSTLDGLFNYSIIMGTSANGGKVCNDLFSLKNTKLSIPRSLQMVKTVEKMPVSGTNIASEELAKFSGFYELSSGESAFLSIEGEYKTQSDGSKEYTVTLGISEVGSNSTLYTFDDTMTFEKSGESWVLTIPSSKSNEDALKVTFTRKYEKAYPNSGSYYGSVISISGSYNGTSFTGNTLLNVVPLMGFAGAPLKLNQTSNETIVIKSSSEVEYNGVSYKNLTVVPLMYIVGFIDNSGNEVVLSLGTDGGKGNTCITTVSKIKEVNGKSQATPISVEVYTAIPDGDSGAPKH
ncbi:hypothetical protein [Tenacibaculum aiptasiae]|uniref:hypothetical protein n=1 Tax=Tenacibaculum aiptasiae TaxID=426481 RepID=UPI003B5947E2